MTWLISLLVGIGVGTLYALLGVKSPAPPLVALFGLLGMVAGEEGVLWLKEHRFDKSAVFSSNKAIQTKAESE